MPPSLREVIQNLIHTKDEKLSSGRIEEDDDAIALLEESEKDASSGRGTPVPEASKPSSIRLRYIVLGLAGVFLLLAASGFAFQSPRRLLEGISESTELSDTNVDRDNHYFHLVIPGTSDSSADFCKTVLSGAVLNYPTPWAIVYDTGNKTNTTYSKIERVSAWMNRMPEDHDEDIVAVIGNPLSWFQVRPDVFIQRYFDVRKRRGRRLVEQFTTETRLRQDITARIVFSSEMNCSLQDASECLGVQAEDGSTHFLNTGVAVGPLEDMRELWKHATAKANETILSGQVVDQDVVFTSLLRRQVEYRELIKTSPAAKLASELSFTDRSEFGISLDFGRELSYAADDKLEGVEWVKHPKGKTSLMKLPKDIAASQPPFWSYNKSLELPLERTWNQVPFLTGIKENIIPSIVQRGPSADVELGKTWWEKMWFQPYGRKLLDNFAQTRFGPVALVTGEDGRSHRFWSPHREKVGIKTGNNKFYTFNSTCGFGEDWREVFLDEGGPWVDPRP